METRHSDDRCQYDDCRNNQQLHSSEEVVEAEAEVVESLTIDAMRRDHQRECQDDRNSEGDLVCADERKDYPLGDQARDDDRHDLPQCDCWCFEGVLCLHFRVWFYRITRFEGLTR